MGIVVSVVIGMALTLPISSAAICAAFGLTGLAGGAAVAGCCANMVGFAVLSFRENSWGGLVSQGLGTSMLQMGNIVKNPRIWLPAILTSAITGPMSTCLFHLEMNGAPVSAGMGTCGLVGQIGVWTGWPPASGPWPTAPPPSCRGPWTGWGCCSSPSSCPPCCAGPSGCCCGESAGSRWGI